MKVPFLDLKRQYAEIRVDVERAVVDVMRSCSYIEGPAVKEFEDEIARYLGVRYAITCGNGTDALKIALKAAGVGPDDEVITTPFSFFATSEAISNVGALPVFVDVREDSFDIDYELIESAITKKTKAILPVHIFGVPADMDEINRIAKQHNLAVIEDACQAIGAEYKGRMAGALGDLGCFSFYPTKNLGAFGDGGMITTDDESLANACRAFKSHAAGKPGYEAASWLGYEVDEMVLCNQAGEDLYDPYKYYNYLIGDNSRLDSIQAAVLLTKMKHLKDYNRKRKEIAELYNSAFFDLNIRIPLAATNQYRSSAWHQYAILCDKKNELIKYLAEYGVGSGSFYPVPLHLQKAYSNRGFKTGSMPVAERICNETVCLPIYPELTMEEQDYIIEVVRRFTMGKR